MEAEKLSGPSWGLVLVRIACGWILLTAGWSKVSGGVSEELVLGTRDGFAQAPGIVRAWGEHVVLPQPWIFAHLIAWGELLGGIALFLGAFTRPVGILAALMFVQFRLVGPESGHSIQMLMAVACLGCAISRAGRKFGADVFLDSTFPRWMTW